MVTMYNSPSPRPTNVNAVNASRVTDFTQDRAREVALSVGEGVQLSYFQSKSLDGIEMSKHNEDGLGWLVDPEGLYAFVVCDGVSRSFAGHLAADYITRVLRIKLFEWVRAGEAFQLQDVMDELNGWKNAVQEMVERHPLPVDVDPMTMEIIRERLRKGSQAVFFAACIDRRPNVEQRSLFVWMGNTKGQVFDPEGRHLLDLDLMKDDSIRWSSLEGCRGEPLVGMIPTEKVSLLVIWSDGIDEAAEVLRDLRLRNSEAKDAELIARMESQTFSDDASLLIAQFDGQGSGGQGQQSYSVHPTARLPMQPPGGQPQIEPDVQSSAQPTPQPPPQPPQVPAQPPPQPPVHGSTSPETMLGDPEVASVSASSPPPDRALQSRPLFAPHQQRTLLALLILFTLAVTVMLAQVIFRSETPASPLQPSLTATPSPPVSTATPSAPTGLLSPTGAYFTGLFEPPTTFVSIGKGD